MWRTLVNDPATLEIALNKLLEEKLGSLKQDNNEMRDQIRTNSNQLKETDRKLSETKVENGDLKRQLEGIQMQVLALPAKSVEKEEYNKQATNEGEDSEYGKDEEDALNVTDQTIESSESIQATNRRRRLGWWYRRNDKSTGNIIYNTQSIHMYAISVTTKTSRNRWDNIISWLIAIVSIIVVALQILVLYWLIWDVSHPACSTHTDCQVGMFCQVRADALQQPACQDCAHSQWDEEFCLSVKQAENWNYVDIDHSLVWFEKDHTIHHSLNETDPIKALCLADIYCNETSLAGSESFRVSTCGHLRLEMSKFGADQQCVLIFVLFLFAAILCQDIEETAIEEVVLDHKLEQIESINELLPPSTHLIRLSLRVRRYIFPWVAASAAIAVLIADSLSAKNILLNLLAIGFVTETDNMVATLFLTHNQRMLANPLVRDAKDIKISFWGSRALGLTTVCSVFFLTNNMEQLERFADPDSGACSGIIDMFATFFMNIAPSVAIAVQGIAHFAFPEKELSKSERGLWALLEVCRNAFALSFTIILMMIANLGYMRFRQLSLGYYFCAFFALLFFGCITVFLNQFILHRRKKKRNTTSGSYDNIR